MGNSRFHASSGEGMHSIVSIKQVPDSAQIRLNPLTNVTLRQGGRVSSTDTRCLRTRPRAYCVNNSAARSPRSPRSTCGAAPNAARRCCAQGGRPWPTIAEGSQICRGIITGALRAALGPVLKWSGQEAGVENIPKYGVRASPIILERVFAPSPHAEKSLMAATKQPTELLMIAIWKGQPKLQTGFVAHARGF
ncbi:hypothetical protein [Bradyrhizobium neotropicale]|uniref:hypothetical protein n=1 Tax=Bradyrhizobium neotropicale TaxID=1497615 RepID=UPI001FED4593|nr:hypothetical protein [Bradyrhizobium neotropicale]